MTIAVITGSHKQQGESTRIGHWLADAVQQDGYDSFVLDLHDVQFPMWDEGLWGAEGLSNKWAKIWGPWAERLQQAEGIVLVVPEYHGTVPAVMRNFLHIVSAKEVGHKPGLIVSVSASVNGAYPVAELRSTGTKNNRLCFVPDHLIIRNAANMLQAEVPADHAGEDAWLRERVHYTLGVFYEYMKALRQVRDSGKTPTEKFTNGM